MSTLTKTPVITKMTVVPVAGYDSMLMTLSGAHAPVFTRNLVILEDSSGHTGVGEIHGGDYTCDCLNAMKPLVEGQQISQYRKVLQKIHKLANPAADDDGEGIQTLDISKLKYVVKSEWAIECAMMDLFGQFLGVPMCDLMGEGQQRKEVEMLGYLFYVSDRHKVPAGDMQYLDESDSSDPWFRLRREEILTPERIVEEAEAVREKTFFGDLGKMLYPATAKPEYNYKYDINASYKYVTPTKSVEEAVIKTANPAAEGSLYMYRDSFGNALLPYFANAYGSAYFTKAFPVNLAADMGSNKPDTVAIELAERNIDWLESMPPVFEAPEATGYTVSGQADGSGSVKAKLSDVNMQLVEISGSIDSSLCTDETEIFVELSDRSGKQRLYKAFCVKADDGEGFLAYVPAADHSGQLKASVVTGNGGSYTRVLTEDISISTT